MEKDDGDVPSRAFSALGLGMIGRARGLIDATTNRRFRALFGAGPGACATIWQLLAPRLPASPRRGYRQYPSIKMESFQQRTTCHDAGITRRAVRFHVSITRCA